MQLFKFKEISQNNLIIVFSFFLTTFYNFQYFEVLKNWIYVSHTPRIYFLLIFQLLLIINLIFITLIAHNRFIKFLLISILLISTISAYFIDTYKVIINEEMLFNAIETNWNEVSDLMSLKFSLYLFFLFLIPSIFIYKLQIKKSNYKKQLKTISFSLFLYISILSLMLFFASSFFSSFLRDQKHINYYANPINTFDAIIGIISDTNNKILPHKIIGLDAKKNNSDKRNIVIMIVGETARADRFALNDYPRNTNPKLLERELVNFSNVYSCATNTRLSVPCMFSHKDREDFDVKKFKYTDNVLDILDRVGVKILWRDNNSSSKNVADRVIFESFLSSDLNPVCDNECRDEGMVIGLEKFIRANKEDDVLIVLHSMGSHGPAYYQRVPDERKLFFPECKTNQLEKCTKQELTNSYDNTIVYTDFFIDKVIKFLETYKQKANVHMIYVSDHGESLGENSLYLHGLPYFIAPVEQKHVPLIYWTNNMNSYEVASKKSTKKHSHDNIFHSLLGLYGVETSLYKKDLDLFTN